MVLAYGQCRQRARQRRGLGYGRAGCMRTHTHPCLRGRMLGIRTARTPDDLGKTSRHVRIPSKCLSFVTKVLFRCFSGDLDGGSGAHFGALAFDITT
eukprot:4656891-Pleurochrysis_carterae.AAC.2